VYLRPYLFQHPPCKYAAVVQHRLSASEGSRSIAVENRSKQYVHEVDDIDVTMCSLCGEAVHEALDALHDRHPNKLHSSRFEQLRTDL